MSNRSFLKKSHFKIYDSIIPIFRIISILALVIFTVLSSKNGIKKENLIFLFVYFIYALIILTSRKLRELIALKYPFLIGMFETIILTYGVFCSGGSGSIFFYTYIMVIAFYAIVYNIYYSLFMTMICIVSYLIAIGLLKQSISAYIFLQILYLIAFGIFTGIISGRINKYNINLAVKDQLTSLYNRQYLYGVTKNLFSNKGKNKKLFSMVVIDVNDFKLINDKKGHLEGDRILKEVGSIIRNNVSEADVAARFGGDEFVIILMDMDRKATALFCENLTENIREVFLNEVTLSIGYSVYPEDGETEEQLMHIADMAMYEAKLKRKRKL